MVSALTLLKTDDSAELREKWSYVLLVEELRRVSAEPKKDASELFRRMCFNALISNTDDHPRNHAIIARRHDWKLSPAYDLVPAAQVSLERRDLAMICGDKGRLANATNLLSEAARFSAFERRSKKHCRCDEGAREGDVVRSRPERWRFGKALRTRQGLIRVSGLRPGAGPVGRVIDRRM